MELLMRRGKEWGDLEGWAKVWPWEWGEICRVSMSPWGVQVRGQDHGGSWRQARNSILSKQSYSWASRLQAGKRFENLKWLWSHGRTVKVSKPWSINCRQEPWEDFWYLWWGQIEGTPAGWISEIRTKSTSIKSKKGIGTCPCCECHQLTVPWWTPSAPHRVPPHSHLSHDTGEANNPSSFPQGCSFRHIFLLCKEPNSFIPLHHAGVGKKNCSPSAKLKQMPTLIQKQSHHWEAEFLSYKLLLSSQGK